MTSINTSQTYKLLNIFQAVPLPEKYARKAHKLSPVHQIAIALMLNLLSLALPIMMLQIYDRIIPHQSISTLIMLIVGVLAALSLDVILRVMRAWLIGWSAASHEHNISCAAVEHLMQSDVPAFETSSPGEHLQNLNAFGKLREFYSGQAMIALIDLPFASLFLFLIAYLGGWLVVVPLVLLITFVITAKFTGTRLKNALETRLHADDRKTGFIVSVLQGIHSVKAMAIEAPLLRRFEKAQADVTKDSYRVALASCNATNLSAAFGQLTLILTAGAGAIFVINDMLTIGALSACTLLAGRAIQPIQRVLGTWMRLQDLAVAKEHAQAVFNIPVYNRLEKSKMPPAAEGRVVLEDITFGYDPDHILFNNLYLQIDPGEVISITGDKGSGKSTLLEIMAGILSPHQGLVSVDTLNPAHYSMSDMVGRIGYMTQNATIFRGSILDNLTGFRSDEETIQKVKAAAIELGLDEVVDLLPRGYQTILTDTAADPVPPGVKQRICLTRVLAHRPSLLLFDDADRALDKEGYNKLFRIMGRLKGSCTLVIVSQDQNLLSFADRSFVIEKGKLKLLSEHSAMGKISHLRPQGI